MSNEAREKAWREYNEKWNFDTGSDEYEHAETQFKDGYDSRDAEVAALREQFDQARTLAEAWAEIAVSSGTQENEDEK